MRVTLDYKILKERLQVMFNLYQEKVVNLYAVSRNGTPSLLLEAAENGSFFRTWVPLVSVEEATEAPTIVNPEHLTRVSATNKGAVLFTKNNRIHVECGAKFKAYFDTYTTEKISTRRPKVEVTSWVDLPYTKFLECVMRTNINPSIPNPRHGSRLLSKADEAGIFRVSCADSFHAAHISYKHSKLSADVDITFNADVLLPLLNKIPSNTVRIAENAGLLCVEADDFQFYYPGIDDKGEDVREVMLSRDPKTALASVPISHKDLVDSIKSAVTITGGSVSSYDARVRIKVKKDRLIIESTSDSGNTSSLCDLKGTPTGKAEVLASSKYLLELLQLAHRDCTMLIWEDCIMFHDEQVSIKTGKHESTYHSAMPTIVV
jgi:hypothetical protein